MRRSFKEAAKALSKYLEPNVQPITAEINDTLAMLPLARTEMSQLLTNDLVCRKTGNNLLHRASVSQDYVLAKTLIGFDMPMDTKNLKGQTPLAIAESIYSERRDPSSRRMKAFLKTRAAFAETLEANFSANRVLRILNDVRTQDVHVNRAETNTPFVTFCGLTQSGKSSLLNFLLGTEYEKKGGSIVAVGGAKEKVHVGTGVASETIHPSVWKSGSGSSEFLLVDNPGFSVSDTRSPDILTCVSASTQIVNNQLKGDIQALAMIVPQKDLTSEGGTGAAFSNYRIVSAKIGKQMRFEDANNVVLLVTFPSSEFSLENIRSTLQDLRETFEREMADQTEGSAQYEDSLSRITVSDMLLRNFDTNVRKVDILDTRERVEVLNMLGSLPPVPKKNYNFSDEGENHRLRHFFKQVSTFRNNLDSSLKKTLDSYRNIESEVRKVEMEIENFNSVNESEKDNIQENLRTCIDVGNDQIEALNREILEMEEYLESGVIVKHNLLITGVQANQEWIVDPNSPKNQVLLDSTFSREDHEKIRESFFGGEKGVVWVPDNYVEISNFEILDMANCSVVVGVRSDDGQFKEADPHIRHNSSWPYCSKYDQVSSDKSFLESAKLGAGQLGFAYYGEKEKSGDISFDVYATCRKLPDENHREDVLNIIKSRQKDLCHETRVLARRNEYLSQLGSDSKEYSKLLNSLRELKDNRDVKKERYEIAKESRDLNEDIFKQVEILAEELAVDLGQYSSAAASSKVSGRSFFKEKRNSHPSNSTGTDLRSLGL